MPDTKRGSGRRRRRRGASQAPGRGPTEDPRGRSGRSGGDGARSRSPRAGTRPSLPELREVGPFAIFCLLHLGITEQDGFAPARLPEVARRLDLAPEELEGFLRDHKLREADLLDTGFDLESARLDIEVAPPGISRVELARTLFEELEATRLEGVSPSR